MKLPKSSPELKRLIRRLATLAAREKEGVAEPAPRPVPKVGPRRKSREG